MVGLLTRRSQMETAALIANSPDYARTVRASSGLELPTSDRRASSSNPHYTTSSHNLTPHSLQDGVGSYYDNVRISDHPL